MTTKELRAELVNKSKEFIDKGFTESAVKLLSAIESIDYFIDMENYQLSAAAEENDPVQKL